MAVLHVDEILQQELVHYADATTRVTSRYNVISIERDDREARHIRLPTALQQAPLSWTRLGRRLFRLDQCNVLPVAGDLVIIRSGSVYHWESATNQLVQTLELRQCRSILHQAFAHTEAGQIFFGEYGRNKLREPVPLYRSDDQGRNWRKIFELPQGKARHIHGCFWDPFEKRVWVMTGDFLGECHILVADPDFQDVEWIGDGSQTYRACHAIFTRDAVHWVMDSQLETSFHVRFDRKSRRAERLTPFAGPVWYAKALADGWVVAATVQEKGPAVHDRWVHVMASRDLDSWTELRRFEHDGWPKGYFKFGVLGFSPGEQTSGEFYLHAEAIRGLDGRVAKCSITSD